MKKAPTRFVIFQNYYSPQRHKLFTELQKEIPVLVFYMHTPETDGRKWKAPEKSPYKTVQLSHKKVGPVIFFDTKEIIKELKSTDLVFILDDLPTNIPMFLALGKIKNIVSQDHLVLWVEHILAPGSDNQIKDRYRKTLTWLLALSCNTLLSFSNETTNYLKSLGVPFKGQKIVRTIQAGYTQDEVISIQEDVPLKKKPSDVITYGFLGYFSERKGLKEYLQAIAYDTNENTRFVFYGDGPFRQKLEEAAKNDNRIKVYDYIKTEDEAAKTKAFLSFDFNVVPSKKDPWCHVVIEAAVRGIPSIVSPYVGAKEFMKAIHPNFIMKDTKAVTIARQLYLAASELKTDPDRVGEMRLKTLELASNWTIEEAATRILALKE